MKQTIGRRITIFFDKRNGVQALVIQQILHISISKFMMRNFYEYPAFYNNVNALVGKLDNVRGRGIK